MIKNIKYIFIIIVALAVVILTIMVVPKMFLGKINDEGLKKLDLKSGENIYICRLTTYTGPEWVVVGDKNGLYDINKTEEQVIIEGDFLPFLFRDRQNYIYSKTNFVIKAKSNGERFFTKDDSTKYRVLKAEKWYIYSQE